MQSLSLKLRLTRWFKNGYSYADIQRGLHEGLVSQREFEAYCAVWTWCAFRVSGPAAYKQDAFWKRFGPDAFYRRLNKVRNAFGMDPIIKGGHVFRAD
jgi:hypothetical protein